MNAFLFAQFRRKRQRARPILNKATILPPSNNTAFGHCINCSFLPCLPGCPKNHIETKVGELFFHASKRSLVLIVRQHRISLHVMPMRLAQKARSSRRLITRCPRNRSMRQNLNFRGSRRCSTSKHSVFAVDSSKSRPRELSFQTTLWRLSGCSRRNSSAEIEDVFQRHLALG